MLIYLFYYTTDRDYGKVFRTKEFQGIKQRANLVKDASVIERCTQARRRKIDSCTDSDETFTIELNNSSRSDKQDRLRVDGTGKIYDNYCIIIYDDGSYGAHICEPATKTSDKER